MRYAIAALLIAATPALAAALEVGQDMGKTAEAVTAALKSDGYEVRKVETEDGKIEVYMVKDGKMSEIYVSAETGKITKVETK
jgi:anti-sigma-K factor RskA